MCLYHIPNMENSEPPNSSYNQPTTGNSSMFSGQNGIIIFLLILLIFSFLGINLLIISGNALKTLSGIFGPVVLEVASMLGYSTGHLVNTAADIGGDTAKLGVDIAEGTAHSIGDLLKNASKGGMDESEKRNLEKALTPSNCPTSTSSPQPNNSTNPIQSSISSKKGGWCLVGEDNGARGCVLVDDHDKCMSGQIFPSKEVCLSPGNK